MVPSTPRTLAPTGRLVKVRGIRARRRTDVRLIEHLRDRARHSGPVEAALWRDAARAAMDLAVRSATLRGER